MIIQFSAASNVLQLQQIVDRGSSRRTDKKPNKKSNILYSLRYDQHKLCKLPAE